MSPYEIKLLLNIYAVEDWYIGKSEPIFSETLAQFEMWGLIFTATEDLASTKITEKGLAHVSQLCRLPFPKESKQWIDYAGNVIPRL